MEDKNSQIFKNPYPTFGIFLKTNWWFLLLAFAKAFNNSDDFGIGGIFILIGIILFIMFIYWTIRYKNKI